VTACDGRGADKLRLKGELTVNQRSPEVLTEYC
jgi:hypothetical protein